MPSEERANLRVWCNMALDEPWLGRLQSAIASVRGELVFPDRTHQSNLTAPDRHPPAMDSDIAFGQPHVDDVIDSNRLRWIHLSTAGYTRYDTDAVRDALRKRGAMLTSSSAVYSEPCAQHLLALMLAHSRALPPALLAQQQRSWNYTRLRPAVRIPEGELALIVGYGTIGARLAELLTALRMRVVGIRRKPRGDESVQVQGFGHLDELLPEADHVVNTLPAATETLRFFDAPRFARMKPTAVFYNVGRGDTVDQEALRAALVSGQPAAAYLDVATPEPLPPSDPLWTTPNCWITPHVAGGAQGEPGRLVNHFISNLQRYVAGETLVNQVL